MSLVKSLTLTNYRNHQSLTLQFGDRINLLIGNNAQGKTNILESIYLLGRGKSFRTQDVKDVIAWGRDDCRVEACLKRACGPSLAVLCIDDEKRTTKMDGKKRTAAGFGVVLFVPRDIAIFRAEPQERRLYIDEFIKGLDIGYSRLVRDYKRTLSQRNRILKDGLETGFGVVESELRIWTERLIDHGTEVVLKRARWIYEINDRLPQIYSLMGGVGDNIKIEYIVSFSVERFSKDHIMDAFNNRLREKEKLEKIRGVTLVGPHRDDWVASVEGSELKSFGSQGQMRVAAISLKMVELALSKSLRGESPILLLDDVASELDDNASGRLLEFIDQQDGQVIMTSTNQERLVKSLAAGAKIFQVSKNQDLW